MDARELELPNGIHHPETGRSTATCHTAPAKKLTVCLRHGGVCGVDYSSFCLCAFQNPVPGTKAYGKASHCAGRLSDGCIAYELHPVVKSVAFGKQAKRCDSFEGGHVSPGIHLVDEGLL